jgi:hypothetical protein
LNQFFGADPAYFELASGDAEVTTDFAKVPRLARALMFQSWYLPQVQNNRGMQFGDLVRDIPTKSTLDKFRDDIDKCREDCVARWKGSEYSIKAEQGCYLRCSTDWRLIRFRHLYKIEESFPWVYTDQRGQIALIALASTLVSTTTVGQNAVGFVDDEQIGKLKEVFRKLPGSIQLVLLTLHHPCSPGQPQAFLTFALAI